MVIKYKSTKEYQYSYTQESIVNFLFYSPPQLRNYQPLRNKIEPNN